MMVGSYHIIREVGVVCFELSDVTLKRCDIICFDR